MTQKNAIFSACLLVQITVISLYSQPQRALKVDDLFSLEKVGHATFSPDESLIALEVERAKADQKTFVTDRVKLRSDIWLYDIAGDTMRRLTNGWESGQGYWNPLWSPDGSSLALLSTEGGDNVRLYCWDRATDTLHALSNSGINLINRMGANPAAFYDPYVWLDNHHILCQVLASGAQPMGYRLQTKSRQVVLDTWPKVASGSEVTASIIDSDQGRVYPGDSLGQLLLIDVRSCVSRIIDRGFFRHGLLSPDGKRLAVVKRKGAKELREDVLIRQSRNDHFEFGIIDLGLDGKARYFPGVTTPSQNYWQAPFQWSADSRYVVVDQEPSEGNSSRRYSLVEVHLGDVTSLPESVHQVRWYDDGNLLVKSEGSWHLFDIPSAKVQPESIHLAEPPAKKLVSAPTGGRILARSASLLQVLYSLDLDTGTELWISRGHEEEKIWQLNTHLSGIKRGNVKLLHYLGADADSLRALLLLPTNYEAGRKYPLVTWIYPGKVIRKMQTHEMSKHSDSYINLLPLAGQGYAVLIPSMPRRSTDDCMEIEKGVLPAINQSIDLGFVDAQRIAAMGLSYGGYGTYCLITRTDRFRCAIALSGMSNLTSHYGAFDVRSRYEDFPFENVNRLRNPETGQGALNHTLYQNPWKYIRNSPVFYADRIGTPLLMIYGDQDFVSIQQGEEMFTALYRQGKPARFVRYWGEGHNLISPANIKHMWSEIFGWLERYLGSDSDSTHR